MIFDKVCYNESDMKIECSVEKLRNAVNKVGRIPQKSATLPILACLVLEAKANNLIIKATNLELGIEMTLPVKMYSEGSVAVSAALFIQFVSSISFEQNVVLSVENNSLVIETTKSRTILNILPTTDFPGIPRLEEGREVEMDPKKFVYGAKMVIYAASISSIRQELSSVYIHHQDSKFLTFVATDSFRLAEKKIKVEKIDSIVSLMIPQKNLAEILHLLAEVEEVTMLVDKSQIVFYNQDLYIFSRVVEGNYPDYLKIVPTNFVSVVEVVKQELVESLKSVNLFVDNFQQIRLSFEKDTTKMEVSAKNNEKGENKVQLAVKVKGDGLSLGFNNRYILDGLGSIESDILELCFAGPNKAVVIKGKNDQSFQYLVMPMNK